LAVVTVLLSLSLRPAAALADDAPALDVFATEQAIGTQQIYRAPGAVAALDERTVRAELTPDTRVVLAPWRATSRLTPTARRPTRSEIGLASMS